MTVRDAIAAKDAAKNAAESDASPSSTSDALPATVDPAVLVREAIDEQIARYGDGLLPKATDRFARVIVSAMAHEPNLLHCLGTPEGKRSLILSAAKASLVGLEPNTVTNDCWLEPTKVWVSRRKFRWEARLLLGYRGRRKLMRNDPDVVRVFAEVVREGDDFRPTPFAEEPFHHPFEGRNRDGALKFAYACVVYRGGRCEATPVLWKQDIEWHRSFSSSYNADVEAMAKSKRYRPRSPWITHETDMWLKTALIELSKVADLSVDTILSLLADGAPLTVDDDGRIVADAFVPDPDDASLGPDDDPDDDEDLDGSSSAGADAQPVDDDDRDPWDDDPIDTVEVVVDESLAADVEAKHAALVERKSKAADDAG